MRRGVPALLGQPSVFGAPGSLGVRARPVAGASAGRCWRAATAPAAHPAGRAQFAGQRSARFSSSSADRQKAVSDALGAIAALPRGCPAASAQACRAFLQAHAALEADERSSWWAAQATSEEETHLDALSKALPRGGRVAPKLLDEFRPVGLSISELALRRMLDALGAQEGLKATLTLRGAARTASEQIDPNSTASFALSRLDEKLKEALRLLFSPGLVRVRRLEGAAHQEAARAVATAAIGAEFSKENNAAQRCYGLTHALMDPSEPPLMVAHATLAENLPTTLAEVSEPVPASDPKVGCLWSIAATSDAAAAALQGLGLGQVLRREAAEMLRAELSGSARVSALVPLRGFGDWLHERRAWEGDLDKVQAAALKRAVLGGDALRGKGKVEFQDADGDSVIFRLAQQRDKHWFLEAVIGDDPARRVQRLALADEGRAVRFSFTEAGKAQALQVNVPDVETARENLERVQHLAEAAGLLSADLREPVLRLAYTFLTRRVGPACAWATHEDVHFHMEGGAALHNLHWRADESAAGLAESLGIMASFVYTSPAAEEEAAEAYAADGLDAATFTNE